MPAAHQGLIVRFSVTVLTNLLRAGCSFASGMLLARGLGASGYGDLSFLLGSFAAVNQLLDLGTSTAFFTFIALRRRSAALLALYGGWLALQFVVLLALVGILLPQPVIQRLWLGHQQGIVLVACVSSFLTTQVWTAVSYIGEAVRKTLTVQAAAVGQAALHLVAIAIGAWHGWLTVPVVLWLLVAEYLLLTMVVGSYLVREHLGCDDGARESIGTLVREFIVYCKPLVVYSWIGCVYAFADQWLLQRFGGAEQQGFFAVAQQFTVFSLLLTTSMLKVFWKEVAEARERGNHQRVQRLYLGTARGLYGAGVWLSCLLIPYSRELLQMLLGPGYAASWLCLAILLFYPVHQSLGQIGGTYFYATKQTRAYARIGLGMMTLSLPVTYGLLASPSALVPGLGLGAVGLAIKLVVLQIIGVNMQAAVMVRADGFAYSFKEQVITLASFLGLGWACKSASILLIGLAAPVRLPLAVIAVGGLLYLAASAALLIRYPERLGLTRDQLQGIVPILRGKMASLRGASA